MKKKSRGVHSPTLSKDKFNTNKDQENFTAQADSKFFLRLISSIPLALAILTEEGEFVYVNQKFTSLFGYALEEINSLGNWVSTCSRKEEYCQAFLKIWKEDTNKLVSGESKEVKREFRLTPKLGKEKLVELVCNHVYGLFIIVFDEITEKRKVEDDIRHKNEQLKQAQKLAKIGSWVYNFSSNAFVWSDELYYIFGYKPEEEDPRIILERHLLVDKKDDSKDLVEEIFLNKSGRGYVDEYQIEDKLQNIKYLTIHGKPFCDNQGGRIGVKGIFQDITEKKLQEIELQDINKAKDRLFSIIAHDLKNPIGILAGLTDVLLEAIENHDYTRMKKFGRLLNLSASKSYELLVNLLDWARSQNSKINISPEIVQLSEVLDEIFKLLAGAIEEKEIIVHNTIDPDLNVCADPNMLKAIFRNLISNAIKYSHRKGEVRISASSYNSGLKISVADNGVGINEKKKHLVFNTEAQYTTHGTEKESGTGLGLLVCKEFVERHGGSIFFESTLGEGSVFSFTLPGA